MNIMLWLDLIGSMIILLWDNFALRQLFYVIEKFDQRYGSIVPPEGIKVLESQSQPLEMCTDDELDLIYTAELGCSPWHLTRDGLIQRIKGHREQLTKSINNGN
jgi:hypothetical protein